MGSPVLYGNDTAPSANMDGEQTGSKAWSSAGTACSVCEAFVLSSPTQLWYYRNQLWYHCNIDLYGDTTFEVDENRAGVTVLGGGAANIEGEITQTIELDPEQMLFTQCLWGRSICLPFYRLTGLPAYPLPRLLCCCNIDLYGDNTFEVDEEEAEGFGMGGGEEEEEEGFYGP